MRALIQRVTTASVAVDGAEIARITPTDGRHGLLVLVGVTHDDDAAKAATLARKVWTMRILEEEKSASDLNAPLLVVSQFTLMADTRKSRRRHGRRRARTRAEPLIDEFTSALRALGAHVESGVFGARMEVSLVNDGPVTCSSKCDRLLGAESENAWTVLGDRHGVLPVRSAAAVGGHDGPLVLEHHGLVVPRVSIGSIASTEPTTSCGPLPGLPSLGRNGSMCISRPMAWPP